MEQSLLEQLDLWHRQGKYKKIANRILEIPKDQWDYDLVNHLARAYNNQDQYDKSLELLLSVKEDGADDPLWHYRAGYSYFYLEQYQQAAAAFERSASIDPGDEDAWVFLCLSAKEAGNAQKHEWAAEQLKQRFPARWQRMYGKTTNKAKSTFKKQPGGDSLYKEKRKAGKNNSRAELYTEEEANAVENHIERWFGSFEQVFHEIRSPDIHVDIVIIEPTPRRNYYTLVTMGMGAHQMNVPKELRGKGLDRAEMMVCLPPDWKIPEKDERWYWPLRWLKIMARMPGKQDTWLGWGHTAHANEAFADNTRLCCILLDYPGAFGDESAFCTLPGGGRVNFYQMIPLYQEEMDFKLEHDAQALWDRFGGEVSHVLDIHRKNYLAED